MLTWLQIKNFAIADHIELELDKGLSVITGETGAGKSIIINALGMVLGERAEAGMIKHGEQRAEIQANFDLGALPAVRSLLSGLALDEDNECQLRRVITAESGSKAWINGRMVTVRVLREIGELLLDIHGQHEHQSLLRSDTQRELLDRYAGLSEQVSQLRNVHQALSASIDNLGRLRADSASAREKLDFLKFQAEELEAFSPRQDEWTELYSDHQRIHHQAELLALLQNAENTLSGNDSGQPSLNGQLGQLINDLDRARTIDPQLGPVCDMLQEVQTLLSESEDGLHRAGEASRFDESELEQIEQRYAAYMDLSRKHRVDPERLYDAYQALLSQLEQAENPEQNEHRLLADIERLAGEYSELAEQISQQRSRRARTLSAAISRTMQSLAMEGGKFEITLERTPPLKTAIDCSTDLSTISSEFGRERIRFDVSTNAGMPSQPLAKVASGGELSRISLAIQMLLSDLATVETLVFDEVDVGIGGKTAAVIGKMLATLAQTRQIICITHLPQVAACGTHHYQVSKQQGKKVRLEVNRLDRESHIKEIARMVGGETLNEESIAHARGLVSESATIS